MYTAQKLKYPFAYQAHLEIAANDDTRKGRPVASAAKRGKKNVLIVKWDNSDIGRIAALFKEHGYVVTVRRGIQPLDHSRYGAVIHTARTAHQLPDNSCKTTFGSVDEWAIIARDEIDDIHCAVQLTDEAHPDLQAYVRFLWSLCYLS